MFDDARHNPPGGVDAGGEKFDGGWPGFNGAVEVWVEIGEHG